MTSFMTGHLQTPNFQKKSLSPRKTLKFIYFVLLDQETYPHKKKTIYSPFLSVKKSLFNNLGRLGCFNKSLIKTIETFFGVMSPCQKRLCIEVHSLQSSHLISGLSFGGLSIRQERDGNAVSRILGQGRATTFDMYGVFKGSPLLQISIFFIYWKEKGVLL